MGRYVTKDGHQVRSRAEVIIDNLLFDLKITHQYEPVITLSGTQLRPDWQLPDQNIFIEFWGMEDKHDYTEIQRTKLKLYTEHNVICLSLNSTDLNNYGELEIWNNESNTFFF